MKSKKIKVELEVLEKELRETIYKTGVHESARITGLKQPDLSAWLNGKRNWTWNKILEIAGKHLQPLTQQTSSLSISSSFNSPKSNLPALP